LALLVRLVGFFSFLRRVIERLSGIGLARTAASLAFTTLLGLVPLFTVAFAYVARFPLFEPSQQALESFLLRFFLPGSGGMIHRYLVEFTTKTAEVKGIGTLFVVVTVVLLVAQVEDEINTIWGVRAPRSLRRRAFIYLLGLTAGPVCIGAAVYFMTWLIDESVAILPIGSEALGRFVQPFAFLSETALFTLIYALVPAQPVRFRLAFAGGLLAGAAFEVAKYGFRFYATHFASYQAIYGALAALPLFLIWLYVSWIIVLVGAAVTATLSERASSAGRR
jgi:membrane protein